MSKDNNKLHIAAVASDTIWRDAPRNIETAETHVRKTLELFPDAQLIMFPEISLMGFVVDKSNQAIAEPMDGPTVSSIREMAQKYNVAIIASIIEKGANKPYNTTFVSDRNSNLLASYRKNHLFTDSGEPEAFAPGETLSTFNFEGWKCGLATCFDIRFPRLFEAYNRAGVECVFSVYNWVAGRNKPALFDALIKTRAHENQYFVAGVDRSGADPNTTYHGIGIISNPYGEDLARRHGVYYGAVLDKSEMAELRSSLPLLGSFKPDYPITS